MRRRVPSDRGASKGHKNAMTDPSDTNSAAATAGPDAYQTVQGRRGRNLTIAIVAGLAVIGVVAIVLLILELVGVIDIFNKI